MADRSRSPDNANFFLAWFKWIAGAAFPANPFLYRIFFRTDLGWLCYWDGTRWLTVQEFPAPVYNFQWGYTVNGQAGFNRIRNDYAPLFTRLVISTLVIGTNNATNYWTLQWRSLTSTQSAATNIATSFKTDADGANWANHDLAPSTANPANYGVIDLTNTATLSPGTLFVLWTAYYRLIVT